MKKLLLIPLSLLFLFFSCGQVAVLSPEHYVQWVDNPINGLIKEKIIGDFKYSLQYKPVEYLALRKMKPGNVDLKKFEAFKESQSELQHFVLKIGYADNQGDILKHNAPDQAEYSSRIEYFANWVNQDIKLIDGKDTLPCLIHHFERSYGITPYSSIVLGFNNHQEEGKSVGDKTIIFNDQVFEAGTVKLAINQTDLEKIPHLTIQ